MSELECWVKPNKTKVYLNDKESTVNEAIRLGWEPYDDTEEGIAKAKAVVEKAEAKAKAKEKAEADAKVKK